MLVDVLFQEVKAKYRLPFVLRREQQEILENLIEGKNVFGVLPTGFGKSLPFLIFPLMLDCLHPDNAPHITVTVEPLKSLMLSLCEKYEGYGLSIVSLKPKKEMEKEFVAGK